MGGVGEGTFPRIMGWGICELKTPYDQEGRRILYRIYLLICIYSFPSGAAGAGESYDCSAQPALRAARDREGEIEKGAA